MGQENSSLIDESTPPETLSARTLEAVAEYIKNGDVERVVVMTGAGISTAAGIPDFRSPKTGLYSNLARLKLPTPESVFELDYFRDNPEPFYVLAKELYPGNFHPTISHVFIALLAKKRLLRMLFTQNIDCLEREAGVPEELIVEAHGSFATQRCIECKTPYPDQEMRVKVAAGEVPRCHEPGCGGLVKPDIVFFGESLPSRFFEHRMQPTTADLALVMGSSLTVQPFASLPMMVRTDIPRVLFNRDRVGDFGTRTDDILVLDDCDTGVRRLADALGWRKELEAEWRRIVGDVEAEKQLDRAKRKEVELEDEVNKLADEVEASLAVSSSKEIADAEVDNAGQETVALQPSNTVLTESKQTGYPESPRATTVGAHAPVACSTGSPSEPTDGRHTSDRIADDNPEPHVATQAPSSTAEVEQKGAESASSPSYEAASTQANSHVSHRGGPRIVESLEDT